MITIRSLAQAPITLGELLPRIAHYVSPARYNVHKTETDAVTTFTLELVPLDTPYTKRYDFSDSETMQMYQVCARSGFSFAAYDGNQPMGIALAEHHKWNNTLWIWEFHVAEAYRGQGVGKALMGTLAQSARQADVRALCCETQNTNVPAIRFYRKMGFRLDGINLSLYGIDSGSEIALFMTRNLQD